MSQQKPTILHMCTPAPNLSPFDVNMAVDAGWQHCIPYTGLALSDLPGLTQDAIFSRGPRGVKHTGIFVGGREVSTAMDMLEAARGAMVPPFEVSVFADPSGAFTTAAGILAALEKHLRVSRDEPLEGRRLLVFGGTGPVGITCALLAAKAGADTAIVSHMGRAKAQEVAGQLSERYGLPIDGVSGVDDGEIKGLLESAELVCSAAAAGVQVLSQEHLSAAAVLKVACDVNAVPPQGIQGVGVMDDGVVIPGTPSAALGIGALAVGNVKYRTQQALLRRMLESDGPEYLHFEHAFETAREYA